MIYGIDEAGRGCIIGPMVIAIAGIDPMKEYELKEMGVKDSKELSPKKRSELYEPVKKICKIKSIHISAKELDEMMGKYSLNEIEAIKISQLLKETEKEDTVFIDSPDNIPENFSKRIRKYVPRPPKLVSENKSDHKHLIVGAASIIAKVERDMEIEKIKKELGYDFNSGYTSDKYTIEFLEKHGKEAKVQKYLRHKWSTLKNIEQRKLAEF